MKQGSSAPMQVRALLAWRGIKVSYYAVWNFFEHEGISFKKCLYASEQERPRRDQATSRANSLKRESAGIPNGCGE
jgi:transposase